jgi:hypothetical protein
MYNTKNNVNISHHDKAHFMRLEVVMAMRITGMETVSPGSLYVPTSLHGVTTQNDIVKNALQYNVAINKITAMFWLKFLDSYHIVMVYLI